MRLGAWRLALGAVIHHAELGKVVFLAAQVRQVSTPSGPSSGIQVTTYLKVR